jgi:hypothetical protein
MSIDENASKALYSETLDKPHSPHVGGQVVNFGCTFAHKLAGLSRAAVEAKVFHFRKPQIPLIKRLLICAANA